METIKVTEATVDVAVTGVYGSEDDATKDGARVNELLYGEKFIVLEQVSKFVRGECGHDRYPGFVALEDLTFARSESSHIVVVPRTLVFENPRSDARVHMCLSLGSRVGVKEELDGWARVDLGWIYSRHLSLLNQGVSRDPIEVAQSLLGTPYRFGGRSAFALDCSGLVQLSLGLCGVSAPRDSRDQGLRLGELIPWEIGSAQQKRGDVAILEGHVGMLCGDGTVVHSSGFWMGTARESFQDLVERASRGGQGGICFRRVDI